MVHNNCKTNIHSISNLIERFVCSSYVSGDYRNSQLSCLGCAFSPNVLTSSLCMYVFFPRKRSVYVKNPYLDAMDEDILYHLDLGTKTHNLPAMFGDVKVKVF